MPLAGLEPARPFEQQILSLSRLPISPQRHAPVCILKHRWRSRKSRGRRDLHPDTRQRYRLGSGILAIGANLPIARPSRPRRFWRWGCSAAFALLLTLVGVLPWGYQMEEQLGLPMLFIWRGPITPPPGVVVVRIDDPSLELFRALPADEALWPEPLSGCARDLGGLEGLRSPLNETDLPRGVYACALHVLNSHDVAGVQLDVVFPTDEGRQLGTVALHQALIENPFTNLFGMADMATRLPNERVKVKRNDPTIEALGYGVGAWVLPKGDAYNMMFWTRRDDFDMPMQVPITAALSRIAKELEPALEQVGIECQTTPTTILEYGAGLAKLLSCLDAGAHQLIGLDAVERARIERILTLARDDRVLFFNYYGPPSTLPSIGIATLLGLDEWPSELAPLRDSVAFIGHQNLEFPTTQDDLIAVFKHPNGLGMSGVESSATAFLNVWHNDHIRPLPETLRLAVGVLVLLVVVWVGSQSRPRTGAIAAIITSVIYVMGCVIIFSFFNIWLPWLPVIVALPFALVMTWSDGYAKARRIIERLTGKTFAEWLISHDPSEGLNERQVTGTVLYCDLAGYSSVSRERGMVAAARLIKRMFEGMEVNILAEAGYAHQITGDGIIACWFDDPKGPSDADRACRTALATREVMAALNEQLNRDFGITMRMRIGLNAGPFLVTGMGQEKLHIAVVGETINKGQRIEQLAKEHGRFVDDVAILIDQSVVERLSANHGFTLRPAGRFQLAKSDEWTTVSELG